MPLLTENQIIRDTYEVERFLGEGAFAEVYRVRHRLLGRQAMKVFKRRGMTDADNEEMLGEAVMLSKIGHPNIVRVFDANVLLTVSGAQHGYFTMENVPGGSLEKFWHSHGGRLVPLTVTLDLLKQVCRGLAVAHRQRPPVIHRDLKPQNILVGYEAEGLRARVSDFGLAKTVNPLTLLATTAGTPAFKPPEAFSSEKGDSCAADTWALGVTLYLLLTDRLPFSFPADAGWHSNSGDLFQNKITPASDLNPDADAQLDRVIMKALEFKPERRFQNAMELLDALEAWQPIVRANMRQEPSPSAASAKSIIGGGLSSPDQAAAERMAREALTLKKSGQLRDAADLMEEAFNKWPDLRDKYAGQVKLWRCGISM